VRRVALDPSGELAQVILRWEGTQHLKASTLICNYAIPQRNWELTCDVLTGKYHNIDPERPIVFGRLFGREISVRLRQVESMRSAFALLD
jgi:hypothetical protein